MGFSFECSGGKNLIVYQAEREMVLDENVCFMLRNEMFSSCVLPFETENTDRNPCRIYYDITKVINMRAWLGECSFLEKRKTKKRIEEAINFLTDNGVPETMIEKETQYMFVDKRTENILLLCIPLRENMHNTVNHSRRENTQLPPLPDDIPVPSEDEIGFKNYLDYGRKKEHEQEKVKQEEWFIQKPEYREEPLREYEKTSVQKWDEEPEEEDLYIPQNMELQQEEEKTEAYRKPMRIEEDEEDGRTILLHNPDDEGTVLLKVPPKIKARLIRRLTGEEFRIDKPQTKIGKKAAVVDIYIRGNNTISREHCVITFEDGEYFLEDSSSLNHTYLNKKELELGLPEKLETNSVIQMSDELFDFIIEEEG